MKIWHNDSCPCGSGKKYKKCCMGLESQGNSRRYPSTVYRTAIDAGLSIDAAEGLSRIMEYMIRTDLMGACHSISCVVYIALTELGYAPELLIGEVLTDNGLPFDHSWVEIDDKAIDLAIWKNMQGNMICNPIVMNIDVITGKPHNLSYGIHYLGLDDQASFVQSLSVNEYMNSHPDGRDKLWNLVALFLNKDIDIDALHERYKTSYRTYRDGK